MDRQIVLVPKEPPVCDGDRASAARDRAVQAQVAAMLASSRARDNVIAGRRIARRLALRRLERVVLLLSVTASVAAGLHLVQRGVQEPAVAGRHADLKFETQLGQKAAAQAESSTSKEN